MESVREGLAEIRDVLGNLFKMARGRPMEIMEPAMAETTDGRGKVLRPGTLVWVYEQP